MFTTSGEFLHGNLDDRLELIRKARGLRATTGSFHTRTTKSGVVIYARITLTFTSIEELDGEIVADFSDLMDRGQESRNRELRRAEVRSSRVTVVLDILSVPFLFLFFFLFSWQM